MGILSAGIGAVAAERIAVGARSAENLLVDTMASSRGSVIQELHTLVSKPGEGALLKAVDDGAHLNLLLHPRVRLDAGREGASLMAAQRSGAIHDMTYGAATGTKTYPHSKLLAAESAVGHKSPVAAFTNVSLAPRSFAREDVTIKFGGDAARAAREVLDSTMAGNVPRMRAAVDDARAAGVLFNDPTVGRNYLGKAMYEMVDNAKDRLVVVSKGIDDEAFAHHLVAAKERGVDVSISVRDVAEPSAKILHDGGVKTLLQPTGSEHARINAIIADDTGLASTSYQWRNMLGEHGAQLTSRDSGVVLRGTHLREFEHQLAQTEAGGAALPTSSLPDSVLPADVAKRGGALARENAWEAMREIHGSMGLSGYTTLDQSIGGWRIVKALE